ncbi:prepilin-type N-terminal cleavage/methylation domain-containing protein [bacterium]|jgi:prepilin-type N-terminal cleavage/methylation domain-containing protein|nr:prepilin-type N-terminal cleavage/methylation domain-containing protein [bacterium]
MKLVVDHPEKGFSLIEMVVVVALIGMITVIAIPQINSYTKISLNSTAREMASTVKEAYNGAVMLGKVHRLVYDFKNGEYWAERGPATVLLDTNESLEKEEIRKKFASLSEKKPASVFSLDKTINRKKNALPRGVEFEDIITEQGKEPVKNGIAYTHFFPHGMTEQTIIHLKDNADHKMTLVISPLLGRTQVFQRYVGPEEAYGPK